MAWPTATGAPSHGEVKRLGRHRSAGAVATELPLDAFFAPLTTDQDWHGDQERSVAARYRGLLAVLRARLTDPVVVKVRTRKVTIYVVGIAGEGGWAGLRTRAVEVPDRSCPPG